MEIPGKWAYKLRKDELPQGHPPTPKERKYIAADGVKFPSTTANLGEA